MRRASRRLEPRKNFSCRRDRLAHDRARPKRAVDAAPGHVDSKHEIARLALVFRNIKPLGRTRTRARARTRASHFDLELPGPPRPYFYVPENSLRDAIGLGPRVGCALIGEHAP